MSQPTVEASLPGDLLELIDDVVWTATLDGRELLYANPALERIYDRPRADFLDNPGLWLELVHPDDRTIAEQSAHTLLEQGYTEAIYRIVRPDGEVRWIRDRKHVVCDEAGQPQHIGGIATDITAQKQAEADSAQHQQLLAAFFTQALDGVFLMMLDEPVAWNDGVDKDGVLDYAFVHQRMTRVNPALLAQYRATPEQFLGKTPNDLFKPAIEASRAVWRRLFDQGQLRIETYAPRFDGTVMMVEGDYLCLYDDAGRITGHVGVQRDVTARKQAEAALRESEERYRLLFENSSNAILLGKPDGSVLAANPAACHTLGRTEVEIRQLGREGLIDPADNRLSAAMDERAQTGRFQGELNLLRANGQSFPTEFTSVAFHDQAGALNVALIFQDIGERKQAEQALRDSEEKYRVVFNNDIYAICIFDLKTLQLLDVNAAYERLYGYRRAELLAGMTIHDITAEHQDSEARTQQAIREGTIFIPLRYHRKKDGTVFPVEIVGGPYTWQGRSVMFALAHDITARQQVERALLASERNFRSVIEQSPDAIILADETGQIVEWNRAAEQILGLPKTEVLGQMVWEVQFGLMGSGNKTAERYEQFKASLNSLLKTGQGPMLNQLVEVQIQRPDGWQPFIQSIAFTIESEDGYLLGSIIRDITDRKQAEARLRDSEERFRLLFDHAPDAIILANVATGRLVNVNRAATRLLSKPKAEIIGWHFTELHPPAMRSTARRNFNRRVSAATTNREWQPFENLVQRADGEIVPVEITGGIFELQGQRLLIANFRDIIERKQAENALKQGKERLELVLQGANLGMWDWNVQTGQVIYDERWAEMIGYTLADIASVAASWEQQVHPDDWPAVQAILAAHFEGRSPFYRSEHRVRHKDGRWLWVYGAGMVYERAADGSPLRAAGIHMNITERKQIEAELAAERASLAQRVAARTAELGQALQAKDDFLATMSHELRTPLNGILGMIEILQQEVYGPLTEDQRQPVQIIRHSGQQLLTLINEILDFAEIDTLELAWQTVLVTDACQTGLWKVEDLATQKQVHLSLQLADDDLWVQADPRRLQQILVNLLENAIKFTPSGGAVTLSVSADPAEAVVRLAVRDSGIGIAAADIAKLFNPFTQLDTGLSRQFEGAGMGLALVERLVRLHGGTIEVTSAGVPGQGSCFTVSLPLASTP